MSNYNAKVYMEQGGDSLVVTTGGDVRVPVVAITTASDSTTIPAYGLVTVASTGGTVKSVSVNAPSAGDRLAVHCLNASATGYVDVNVGSGRSFDGTNYIWRFHKAAEYVEAIAASTARWIEVSRSNADGTALNSTTT